MEVFAPSHQTGANTVAENGNKPKKKTKETLREPPVEEAADSITLLGNHSEEKRPGHTWECASDYK